MRIATVAGSWLVALAGGSVACAQEQPAEAGAEKAACCAEEGVKAAASCCAADGTKEDADDDDEDAISATLTTTVTTHYFFRGLLNENRGVIVQPDLELGLELFECDCDCPLEGLALSLDTWNSLHSSSTTGTGHGSSASTPKAWYESDFTAGLAADLRGGFELTTSWVQYTSPNDYFSTTTELDFELGFDDAPLWGENPRFGFGGLQPSVTFAFELDGQSDQAPGTLGTNEGRYLGLGLAPSLSLCDLLGVECTTPVTLELPMNAGFSLGSYYEDANGKDEQVGYFEVGALLSMPLRAIPAKYGDWTFKVGATAEFLHGNLATVNGGENFELVGSAALSIAF